MVRVKPFRGIRPRADLAEKAASLPYDVYADDGEIEREIEKNPLSFLRIERRTDSPDENRYEGAARLLWDSLEKGEFVQDDEPSYYLYELTMDGHSQTGIAGCTAVDDYLSGAVKKHENTRSAVEDDRALHVVTCRAQTGPIFLAHRADDVLARVKESVKREEPLYDFVSPDGIGHRVWRVTGEERTEAIRNAFAAQPCVYIADGHHRAAAAVRAASALREQNPGYTGDEEFNSFLSVLFDERELQILDYNRVVRDLNGLTPGEFLMKLEECFQIVGCSGQPVRPARKGEMGLYLDGNWYHLTVLPERQKDDPVEGLDVSYLQREVLGPVLGITDPRTDPRIAFVGGIRGLSELERRCQIDMAAAFSLYPTSMSELLAVADAGLLMPPKSTWFEPKLRSGLFIHAI